MIDYESDTCFLFSDRCNKKTSTPLGGSQEIKYGHA